MPIVILTRKDVLVSVLGLVFSSVSFLPAVQMFTLLFLKNL